MRKSSAESEKATHQFPLPLLSGHRAKLFCFCKDRITVSGGDGRQDFLFYSGIFPQSNPKSQYPNAHLHGLGRAADRGIEIPGIAATPGSKL